MKIEPGVNGLRGNGTIRMVNIHMDCSKGLASASRNSRYGSLARWRGLGLVKINNVVAIEIDSLK